ARTYYQEEVKLREALGPGESNEMEARREQAGLYDKLGELNIQLGDVEAGCNSYENALKLREKLVGQYPGENPVRRDLLLSYQRLGELSLLQRNDPASARKWYEKALAEFQQQLKDDPDNAVSKRDVALTHYFVATAALRMGDRKAAE